MAAVPQQHMRTAVVTGTARVHGIGRACAKAFLNSGWQVLGVDVQPLEAGGEEDGMQQRYRHLVADISQPEEVAAVPAACTQHFGTQAVRALVNTAGVADPHLPQDPVAAFSRWKQVLDVNLTGAYLMSAALAPHMPPGEAAIVHISSTRAHQSEPHSEAYAAAKAGLLGLTHAQAVSLAHRVRVNAIIPGWIDTSGDPSSISAADHAWHLTGRVGRPADVAELCLFLCEPQRSGFITGNEFVIDGGVSKKMVYPD